MHWPRYEREKEKFRKCFSTRTRKNEERDSLYIGSETLFKCLLWAMWDLKLFFFFFKLSPIVSFVLTNSRLLTSALGIRLRLEEVKFTFLIICTLRKDYSLTICWRISLVDTNSEKESTIYQHTTLWFPKVISLWFSINQNFSIDSLSNVLKAVNKTRFINMLH